MGLQDNIRQHVRQTFVIPFLDSDAETLHLTARQIHESFFRDRLHVPDHRYPAVCSVLDGRKFLAENGLRITRRVGLKESPKAEWWFERASKLIARRAFPR